MRFKFFTIDAPNGKETNTDGSNTCYAINQFINSNENGAPIVPKDISAEYNELSGKLLISVGYKENQSIPEMIMNYFRRKLYGKYQIRFEDLYDYNEKDHTVYIQLALENSVNFCKHENISHGIFVQNHKAKVAFLEYSKTKEEILQHFQA